jgi:hypothetical protein
VFVRDMLGHSKLTRPVRYLSAKFRPEENARLDAFAQPVGDASAMIALR